MHFLKYLDSSFFVFFLKLYVKLYRIVHKNLKYHIKWILWTENKNIYFRFASEIYHGSILLKIRKEWKIFNEIRRIFIYNISPSK